MGISVGLVGLGAFGSEFAGLFKSHPLVDRVAFCDLEPDRVARFAGNPAFQDKFRPSDVYYSVEEICKSDLDALAVITQPWLHAGQAIRAMEAGKHVYSAVPVINLPDGDETLEWCDKLIGACKRTGMLYMLGETTYFRPETMYCRRRAAEGAFGSFVHAEGHYLHDRHSPTCNLDEVKRNRMSSKAGREWAEELRKYEARGIMGGPSHYPTHSVSGPMSVMKAHAVKVSAWGYNADRNARPKEFSNETSLFRMSNGTTMLIKEYRQVGHEELESFNLYGTDGSFVAYTWRDKAKSANLTVDEMRDPLPEEVAAAFRKFYGGEDFYGGHGGSHAYLVHEFIDAVANRRQPEINAWEAVRYMAAGVMAHKSALRDGELLDVPDWGDAPI
ncbi:MAG: Gfo/Idh/MocA family protein [Bacillota bacterium]